MVDFSTIDLDNCDQEPIHVPGFIQPHGVLFALDTQGRLTHASRDAERVLPDLPPLGASLPHPTDLAEQPDGNASPLWRAVAAAVSDAATGQESAPLNLEVALGDEVFDAVLHTCDGRVIVELEPAARAWRRQPRDGLRQAHRHVHRAHAAPRPRPLHRQRGRQAHGGMLEYGHDGTRVTFTVTMPRHAQARDPVR